MKLFCTIFVLLIGFAAGRIGKKTHIQHPGVVQTVREEHSTIHLSRGNDENEIQPNGFPLDHKPIMNPNEYIMVDGTSPFVAQNLKEYEMAPLQWASSGNQVDKHARVVSLPPLLTDEIQNFCVDIGLDKLFQWAAHSDTLDIDHTLITGPNDLKEGHKWAVTRAGEDTSSSNLHWLDAIDETSYEATVDVLKRGNFDYVLNAIAAEFKPWGYMFAGLGFMVGTHSEASLIHQSNSDAGKNVLKLVFPIHMPKGNMAQMYVGNDDEKKVAPYALNYHQGLILSGDTIHGMADFDYRREGNFQIFATIYIADIHDDNFDMISDDNTALFPMSGNRDWLLAQRGRFWGGAYGGSFEFDSGRKPYEPNDELDNCSDLAERGLCLEPSESKNDPGLWDVRRFCSKSCGIFIENDTYYSKVHPPRG